jgi:hypothetical protein
VRFLREAAGELGKDSEEIKALRDAILSGAGAVPLNITDREVWKEYQNKYYETTEERKLQTVPRDLRNMYLNGCLQGSRNLLDLSYKVAF